MAERIVITQELERYPQFVTVRGSSSDAENKEATRRRMREIRVNTTIEKEEQSDD